MRTYKLLNWNSRGRRQLVVEHLEARCTPAQFVVNTLVDTSAGAGGLGTLRYCITQANVNVGPDTITFDATLFASSQTIKLNGSQLPNLTDKTGATTINGPTQAVVINADSKSRVFMIDPGVSVNMDRLEITGGKVSFPGGAGISNSGTLQVTNSTLSNNYSSDVGGGIFNYAKLTVDNCSFKGNTGFSGAAVHSTFNGTDGAVVIVNSSFDGNMATDGGALFVSAPLTVNNSVFTNNSGTGGNGGAICSFSDVDISKSSFIGNSARQGGALNCAGKINITNSNFTANSATSIGGTAGAIYFGGGGTLTINGSTIANNMGRGVGGIWSSGATTISNSSITGNVATSNGSGGGISTSGPLSIRSSTITGNSASYGGAIALSNSSVSLTVYNSTIAGNSATGGGGGIYTSTANQKITLHSTIVAGNTNDISPDFHFGTVSTVSGDNNLVGVVDPTYFSRASAHFWVSQAI